MSVFLLFSPKFFKRSTPPPPVPKSVQAVRKKSTHAKKFSLKYPGVGKLCQVSETVSFLHVKGTPREGGQQIGENFSKDLAELEDYFRYIFKESAGSFLSKLVYDGLLTFYSYRQWGKIPPEVQQEHLGIAEAAKDLSRFKFMRKHKLKQYDLIFDLMINLSLFGLACSSFVIKDKNGNLLKGRNLDFTLNPFGTFNKIVVILWEIEGQPPRITIDPVFFNLAPTTAIVMPNAANEEGTKFFPSSPEENEKIFSFKELKEFFEKIDQGLDWEIENPLRSKKNGPFSVFIHVIFGKKNYRSTPTITVSRKLVQQLSYEEAIEIPEKYKDTCAKKLIISDDKRAQIKDMINEKIVTQELTKNMRFLVATNHLLDRTLETLREMWHALSFNSMARKDTIEIFLKDKWASIPIAIRAQREAAGDPTISNIERKGKEKTNVIYGNLPSTPLENSNRLPFFANQTRNYNSVIFAGDEVLVAGGEHAAYNDRIGFNIKNLSRWAKNKYLPVKVYPQNPDLASLEKGYELDRELRRAKDAYYKGHFEKAKKHLKNFVKTDKDHTDAQVLLGAIALEEAYKNGDDLTKLEWARRYLTKVINTEWSNGVLDEWKKGSAFAHLLLGMSYDLQGHRETAEEHYAKVLSYASNEKANDFAKEAAGWAKKFLRNPKAFKKLLRSHKKMVKFVL